MKRLFSALVLAFLFLAHPFLAQAVEKDMPRPVKIWPFLLYESGPDRTDVEILLSLIYYEREFNRLSLGFRPFYSRTWDPDQKYWRWSALWPLVRYERRDEIRTLSVLPLYRRQTAPDKAEAVLFPAYSYFQENEKRRLGVIGYSPITLFDFRRDFGTGEINRRWLWAFYRRKDEDTSLNFFPLIRHKKKPEDVFSYFFPFYNYERDAQGRTLGILGYAPLSLVDLRQDYQTGETYKRYALVTYRKRDPTTSLSVYPLYRQQRAPGESSTELMPIFYHARKTFGNYIHFSMFGLSNYANIFEYTRDDGRKLLSWHMALVYGSSREGSRSEKSIIWPFFRSAHNPETEEKDLNLLWPLFKRYRNPDYFSERFLPFYARARDSEFKNFSELPPWALFSPLPAWYRVSNEKYGFNRFLWLGWLTRSPDGRKDVFLNYYNFENNDLETRHRGLFPLWHQSKWQDRSLSVAPLWLSYGEPQYAFRTLFPLHWYYRSKNSALEVNLPLHMRYEGGTYSFNAFFPFYYHLLDQEINSELKYYFPLYGFYRRGEKVRRHLLLFPLWSRLHEEDTGINSWDALWPLFHYETGPQRASTRLLPLYWQRRSPESQSVVAFPLFWHFRGPWGSQTHLVPFFGRFLGENFSLSYYLGPLWVRMVQRDYDRTNILGALVSRRRDKRLDGQTEKSGFGFLGLDPQWSLFSLTREGPLLNHRLFPLYSYQTDGYNDALAVFGLGRLSFFRSEQTSDYFEQRFSPFYTYSRAKVWGKGINAPAMRTISLLGFYPEWSLFYNRWSETDVSRWLFPLYSYQRDENGKDLAFLGGGPFSLFRAADGRRWTLLRFSPFVNYVRTKNSKEASDSEESTGLGLVGFSPKWSLISLRQEGGVQTSWLLPLYSRRIDAQSWDFSMLGYRRMSLFYSKASPDARRSRFFPFYSYLRQEADNKAPASGTTTLGLLGFFPPLSLYCYKLEGVETSHWLTPFYSYRKGKSGRWLALLGFQRLSLFYSETKAGTFSQRFFPLYGYRREGRPGEPGYAVNADVLGYLARYKRSGESSDFRLLYRLVRLSRAPNGTELEVNPVWDSSRSKDGASSWSLLGGLFGRQTAPGGRKTFRFLWLF